MRKILNFPSFLRSSYIYRRTYGFRDGLRIALQVRRAEHVATASTLVPIDVPGLRSPIMLRARTADVSVFRQIFGCRELELELASSPRVIIDAGAHIGLSSLWFSWRFPDASIIAIEAESANFALLKMNTASCENIIPLHKALWWEKTELEVQDPAKGTWGFRVTEDPAGEASRRSQPVESVSVSDILGQFNWNTIDLLKMDIEGAELEVFSNGSELWIDCVDVIAVELHDRFRPGCRDAIHRAIAGRGFSEEVSGEYTVLTRT